jgi:hypothetical protein
LQAVPDVASDCDVDEAGESPGAPAENSAIAAAIAHWPSEGRNERVKEVVDPREFDCEPHEAERTAFDKMEAANEAA